MDDLESTKTICDSLCMKINQKGLVGFIHNLESNPLDFFLYQIFK
jgi:hypothetical protein